MFDQKHGWEKYKEKELSGIIPVLSKLGFSLEKEQPHIGGERYLMQAVTTESGRKLILLGHRISDGKRVVIKATSDEAGKREIMRERKCREVLHQMNFAYQVFFSPEEILFVEQSGYLISIQAFIEQKRTFLERPTKEQFSLALKSFKAQEGAHATTYRHIRLIRSSFGAMSARDYISAFGGFKKKILAQPENNILSPILEKSLSFLEDDKETIEQYSGFLTHVDFVPHNIRVAHRNIYLLDHSSLRFGNKYEGWARFLNFMMLYNPGLEKALVQYVRDNRAEEESLSLKLMRIYRLGEIIWYYTGTLEKSSGDLLSLNNLRVKFWGRALEATLGDKTLEDSVINEYKKARDSLRSDEEKKRQISLH